MKNWLDEKIKDIERPDYHKGEPYKETQETGDDVLLQNAIMMFPKSPDKILEHFFYYQKQEPKFGKFKGFRPDLVKRIMDEWEIQNKIQESDEANYKSSHY